MTRTEIGTIAILLSQGQWRDRPEAQREKENPWLVRAGRALVNRLDYGREAPGCCELFCARVMSVSSGGQRNLKGKFTVPMPRFT
jgi:hypothetical protein